MDADLIGKLICGVLTIPYLAVMIYLAKKDGLFEAISGITLPLRCYNWVMGGRFWGDLDQEAVQNKLENKLVGAPIEQHNDYPKELTHTLWGQFCTREGRRETRLGVIRPLFFVVIPMLLFLATVCLTTFVINKFW